MAKPSHVNTTPTTTVWGTWEELLLSCAVHRYGTDNWDSIAAELQNRIPSLKSLTPQVCMQKYYDLKRRFPSAITNNHNNMNSNKNASIPWLDDLRQLRLAELRREVQRYDVSIVSLQLKVKRLREEREEGDRETEKSDLRKEAIKSEKDEEEDDVKRSEPENVTGGEDSDQENRSVNESNSTDPKTYSQGEAEKGRELVEPAGLDGPERGNEVKIESEAGGGEYLCNRAAEESAWNSVRVDPDDSAAGSSRKGNNSDEQSSASLSRKEEEGEDREADGEGGRRCNGSQPLIEFLEIVRSHKLGSIFERRLETQKTFKYNKLVRQHVDFEIIGARLEEGLYSCSNHKFFRDLLLLINNAIIFFAKKSSEYLAAIALGKLVSKELALMRSSSLDTSSPTEEKLVPEEDPGPSRSSPVKSKMRVLMLACRKRSSIPTKASPLFSGTDKKVEHEERPVVELKQQDKSIDKAEDNRVTKKRTRERFSSSTRTSNKNSNKSTKTEMSSSSSSKAGSQNENTESKVVEKEKKNMVNATTSSKKKGAANFLDRMKRSSPLSNNKSLADSDEQPVSNSDNIRNAQQRKSNNSRNDAKKDQNSVKRSGSKDQNTAKSSGVKDQSTAKSSGTKPSMKEGRSPAKKNPPGRPPKRAAASPAPPVVPAKRGRESSVAEASASKKRSRR